MTLRDPTFLRLEQEFTGNAPGTGGLVTFVDSNWLMSIVVAYQPHFRDQPDGVQVFWGYGLCPDRPGNYVPKTMTECTGAEILTELCSHLGFTEQLPRILETSICIPCTMPFVTSQFLTRAGVIGRRWCLKGPVISPSSGSSARSRTMWCLPSNIPCGRR